jgi:hypothetical protein
LSLFHISQVLRSGRGREEISATGWWPVYTTFSPLDRGTHA